MSDAAAVDTEVPGGENYLDALTTAGQRSRSIIYLTLLIVILTFTATRNNIAPSWTWAKSVLYGNILQCLKAPAPTAAHCETLAKKMGKNLATLTWPEITDFANTSFDVLLIGTPGTKEFAEVNALKLKEMRWQHEGMMKKGIDQTSLSVPLFGATIDFEDLWLVSTVSLALLLYFLWSSIEQEHRIVSSIAERKRGYLELMLLSQDRSWLRASARLQVVRSVLWLLPTAIAGYLLFNDLSGYRLSVILGGGPCRAVIEYGIEVVAVAAVAYLNIRSLLAETRLQGFLHDLAGQLPSAKAAI
jgi:hypothetical protein